MATSVISQVLGSAASGPLGIISTLVSKAMDFIPDPEKKLELQQHAMDLQAQAAQAELEAVTKQVQASAASQSDVHLARIRSGFCLVICAAIFYNLILVSLLNAVWHVGALSVPVPTNLLVIFAVIMLGLVGVPQAMSMVREVMGMPGDSQINVLGIKVGNKS